jgi:hypothetical protein
MKQLVLPFSPAFMRMQQAFHETANCPFSEIYVHVDINGVHYHRLAKPLSVRVIFKR